jgi:hypothetical protein
MARNAFRNDAFDMLSERFDPASALEFPEHVRLPCPQVAALDNLSKCRWMLPRDDPNYLPLQQSKPKEPKEAKHIAAPSKPPSYVIRTHLWQNRRR